MKIGFIQIYNELEANGKVICGKLSFPEEAIIVTMINIDQINTLVDIS